jgi:hypothetical protein
LRFYGLGVSVARGKAQCICSFIEFVETNLDLPRRC